jgi:hypothetical protein
MNITPSKVVAHIQKPQRKTKMWGVFRHDDHYSGDAFDGWHVVGYRTSKDEAVKLATQGCVVVEFELDRSLIQ